MKETIGIRPMDPPTTGAVGWLALPWIRCAAGLRQWASVSAGWKARPTRTRYRAYQNGNRLPMIVIAIRALPNENNLACATRASCDSTPATVAPSTTETSASVIASVKVRNVFTP